MKRFIIYTILCLCSVPYALCTTIEECYTAAESNYPLIAQYDIIDRIEKLTLENISKTWLPQATLSAKASWQTATTKIPIDFSQMGMPGIETPSMAKDQYGLTLDVTQTIWDGGASRSARDASSTASDVTRRNIDVNTYTLRSRVNQLYFGILLSDDYLRLNKALLADLYRMISRIENCIKEGVANKSDADAMRVQVAKAQQQMAVYNNNRATYIEMLSALTGLDLNEKTEFAVPQYAAANSQIQRPELSLFEARLRNSKSALASLISDLMPRFNAFVTGGYGRPGPNMFERSFSPYAIIGIRGSWNIGAFYTKDNKRKLIEADIANIETERETFLFNTSLDITQTDREMQSWRDQLRYDDEIISLQQSIVTADEAKLAAGTISGTDLANDINAVHTAKLNKALHETMLLMNSYQRKYITN